MNSVIKSTFIFTIGAAIGSVVTWKLIKTKYEQIASDEIASVKEHYSKKYSSNTDETEENNSVKKIETTNNESIRIPETPKAEEPDIMSYAKQLKDQGYTDYSAKSSSDISKVKSEEFYVITPEEFGEHEDYDTISLYHYTDGVLADRDDDRITNFAELVGADYADHIGEYEDDAAHIRNDRLKCDFEILRSAKSYKEDVVANLPYDLE